jgi:hypothetical protein
VDVFARQPLLGPIHEDRASDRRGFVPDARCAGLHGPTAAWRVGRTYRRAGNGGTASSGAVISTWAKVP